MYKEMFKYISYIFINMTKTKSKEKGLGDTLENLIKKLKFVKTEGTKKCTGCKARKEKLNKLFPYNKLMI